jgi:uncharacterized protein (DUF1499 family)
MLKVKKGDSSGKSRGRSMAIVLATVFSFLTAAIQAAAGGGHQGPDGPPGRLAPCSAPNCVSSKSPDVDRRLAPLIVIGKPADAMAAVKQLLGEQKRTRIVRQTNDYILAEVRSAIFRFVDDVEFLVDDNAYLHFRSAARIGYWDLGVNRRRMVRIRQTLVSRYSFLFKEIF